MAKNVWQKNQIPPLEFCPIDRAAKLLSCEINDILSWVSAGKIAPLMEFGLSTVHASMGVKLNSDKNPSLERGLSNQYLYIVKYISSGGMHPIRPLVESDSYKGITLLEFPAYFSGLAKVTEGLFYVSGTSFIISLHDLSCDVIINREEKHIIDDDSCLLGVDSLKFNASISNYDDEMEINVDASQLFLYQEDIERIYTYGLTGEVLPDLWASQSNQLSVSGATFGGKGRETAKQASTIAFLINALGVSLEDLKSMPLPKILDKLSHSAREYHLPNITPEALGHWLAKAGVR